MRASAPAGRLRASSLALLAPPMTRSTPALLLLMVLAGSPALGLEPSPEALPASVGSEAAPSPDPGLFDSVPWELRLRSGGGEIAGRRPGDNKKAYGLFGLELHPELTTTTTAGPSTCSSPPSARASTAGMRSASAALASTCSTRACAGMTLSSSPPSSTAGTVSMTRTCPKPGECSG